MGATSGTINIEKRLNVNRKETVPNGNTVLLFHLNNDSSYEENDTFIYDFSNKGNNGTAVGAVPTPNGNLSGGFEFDGFDDYVDAGSGDSIDDVHTFTWEAWIRPHLDTDGQSHRVIVKGTGGGQKRFYLVHGAGVK